MIITGSELIECFKNYCKKYHKLFIPDSPRQEQVADALASFYKKDNLENAVEYFIESRTFVERVEFEKKSQDKFKDIVQETKKRLES